MVKENSQKVNKDGVRLLAVEITSKISLKKDTYFEGKFPDIEGIVRI